MKPDIHTIIEMIKGDPMAVSVKFGVPLRTVYGWCNGTRQPPDYVICMMLTIILLERRLGNGNSTERLAGGMDKASGGIEEAGKESESEVSKT